MSARTTSARTTQTSLETWGFIYAESYGLYVARCPEFRVVSQGTSPEDARMALEDALRQHLAFHQRRGDLQVFLDARHPDATAFGERVPLHITY